MLLLAGSNSFPMKYYSGIVIGKGHVCYNTRKRIGIVKCTEKPCLSIMIGTMIICNSALRTVVVMHANGEENMRLGCVCAKCDGLTFYIACAIVIRNAVAAVRLR